MREMVTHSTETVRTKEKLAYGFGCFGQNFSYYFLSNYILFFFTDVFGILPAAAGTLLLVTKIWDGINDPLMGILVDRTRSRWGKFRPWLIFTPILFAPISIMCFSAPDLTPMGKLIWAYATYILFDMTYTASDVPYWAMSSAITANTTERNSVVVYPRFIATVAVAIATLTTLPLVHLFQDLAGGDAARGDRGFQLTAALYGILTVACFAVTFFLVRERVVIPHTQKRSTAKDILVTLGKNKPLMLLIISGLFVNAASGAKLSTLIYYAKYNLGNEMLNPVVAAVNIPFILIGIAVTPKIAKRYGKKTTYIILNAIFAVGSLGFYLSGWENLVVMLAWSCFGSIGMAAPLVLQTSMIADTIEYAELKTGQRSEGLIFSSQTFMVKLASAFTSWITGLLLAATGFIANATQSQSALTGIHLIMSLFPFLACTIAIIPMFFYPLTEKKHGEILRELESR
ncbi:MAG: MFS transporter [Sphaerochaetaceae bacterium]|jgi:GPH family glycoside/pentoside/hexuronide:cation symporter/probable glucitol transport protein GutA|nr:MFS transporter [Sphaerochaetaceae bacterium]